MLTITKVSVHRVEDMQLVGKCRNHEVIIDQPEERGGHDEGMRPTELMLCALGGCLTGLALGRAEMERFQLDDFYVEIEGDRDTRGEKGSKKVRSGFQEIRVIMHMKTNESPERCEKFAHYIEELCTVSNTFKHETPVKVAGVERY
mgnify:CR=1 FL=1